MLNLFSIQFFGAARPPQTWTLKRVQGDEKEKADVRFQDRRSRQGRALPPTSRRRRRADRGRTGRDREHGECGGAAVGSAARSQLGGLLSQRKWRTGAWPVPGASGLHPYLLRQGRMRQRRREAGTAMRRGCESLPRPEIGSETRRGGGGQEV